MTEAAVREKIADELEAIRHDIDYIKKHMADVDIVLTDNDIDAFKDFKAGKTKRL
ncbi:MAG: hypothetical protein U9P44_00430 [archaeon]|nr:hypothetical protein [archaeon]